MSSSTLDHTPSDEASPDMNQLVDLFVRAFPRLDTEERALALKLYALLAEGEAVSNTRLAEALARPREGVHEILSQWPGVFHDEADNVIGFWGLSVKEMRHRLRVNGKISYAWCAWDTLFIPELLNTTVEVFSACARSGVEIRLTASPSGVRAVEPSDIVLSFLAPDESELRADVTTSFCHFVHFFRSRDDGEAWVAEHDGTFLLSLEDAFQLGKQINAARYAPGAAR